jgi:predicted SAM-dependent methyltransferase
MKKYLNINSWRTYFKKRNAILDNHVRPIKYDDLKKLKGVEISKVDIASNEYKEILGKIFPNWNTICPDPYYKKFLEFSLSWISLSPEDDEVMLDAAGGIDTYINNIKCKKKYVSDIKISKEVKNKYGQEIGYLESDVSNISLPNSSVDKIACHHSFEHFQAKKDIEFISEIQRILTHNGRCCIVPIFIADQLYEITNYDKSEIPFDKGAVRIVDPTSTFTGGKACGDFARIYDLESFQGRIINNFEKDTYSIRLKEVTMDGKHLPEMRRKCHRTAAKINCPLRVLIVEKKTKISQN